MLTIIYCLIANLITIIALIYAGNLLYKKLGIQTKITEIKDKINKISEVITKLEGLVSFSNQ